MDNKAFLRKQLINQRNLISPSLIESMSFAISEKIFTIPEFEKAKNIFVFLSFGSEVNTSLIIDKLLKTGKSISVPVIKEKKMFLARYKQNTPMIRNKYGILEPAEPTLTDLSSIDLTLVPALAFDYNLYRIGYGGGFYDRFIADYNKVTIGIIFDEFIIEDIPIGEFDKPVDIVVSNKQIIYRNEL